MDSETPVPPWEAVLETVDGNLFRLPFDTFRVPQDGTLWMCKEDGELHPTHFVHVKEGDKLTYNSRPPVEYGYLDGWPAFPKVNQKYVTVDLLPTGYRMVFFDGNTRTQVTYES